jgi:hypothetical protein
VVFFVHLVAIAIEMNLQHISEVVCAHVHCTVAYGRRQQQQQRCGKITPSAFNVAHSMIAYCQSLACARSPSSHWPRGSLNMTHNDMCA